MGFLCKSQPEEGQRKETLPKSPSLSPSFSAAERCAELPPFMRSMSSTPLAVVVSLSNLLNSRSHSILAISPCLLSSVSPVMIALDWINRDSY